VRDERLARVFRAQPVRVPYISSTDAPLGSSTCKATMIHSYFTGGPSPVVLVAEHAFSSGGTTGSAKRNRLKPKAFEALQLLKSAYRNGHLAAEKEPQKHIESVLELLDDEDKPSLSPRWKGKGKQVDFEKTYALA